MIYQLHKPYKNPSLGSGKVINSIILIRDGGVGVGSGSGRGSGSGFASAGSWVRAG